MSSRIELVFIENCSKCDIEVKSSDILCDPVVCKDCFSEELSLDEKSDYENDEKLEQVPSETKDKTENICEKCDRPALYNYKNFNYNFYINYSDM